MTCTENMFPLYYIFWKKESIEKYDDAYDLTTELEFYSSDSPRDRKFGVVVDRKGRPVHLKLEGLEILELSESNEPIDQRALQILLRYIEQGEPPSSVY